jgi:hypothetical protein
MMDALDVILAVEGQDLGNWTEDDLIEGLSAHRDSLRRLQGSWGRYIERLEEEGVI